MVQPPVSDATPSQQGASKEGPGASSNNASEANFQRSIDARQMVFLALAGGMGAGIFVASGSALTAGGPANALLNYALVGLMVCTTMGALGELASRFPNATVHPFQHPAPHPTPRPFTSTVTSKLRSKTSRSLQDGSEKQSKEK